MADTLTADVGASLAWVFRDELDLSTVADTAALAYDRSLPDGTGADQADKIWHATRTLAGSTHDDLDLTALARTLFGASLSISLARVKALLVINTSTTAGETLRVGGAAANAFAAPFNDVSASIVEVGPDSALLLTNKKDGWPVTNGSSDVLRVANPNATSVTYKIAILGTSA